MFQITPAMSKTKKKADPLDFLSLDGGAYGKHAKSILDFDRKVIFSEKNN